MRLAVLLALCSALVLPAAGAAATRTSGSDVPEIAWGAADDASKFADDGGHWFYGQLSGASLTQNRWTVAFDPSNPTAINELPFLERAAPVAQAAGVRIILVALLAQGLAARPDAVLRLGEAGRPDREPVGHPRLRRRQRGEYAPLLVAAEGRQGQGRRGARISRAARALLRHDPRDRPRRERDRDGSLARALRRTSRTSRSSSCATSARRIAPPGAPRRSWISCRCIRTRTRGTRPTGPVSATTTPTASACRTSTA